VQLLTIGLLLSAAVVFGSGIWLARGGRPYGVGLTTVHKLVDLAAVVVIGTMVFQAHRASPLPMVEWVVVGLAALFSIAGFITGGLVSARETIPNSVLWLHRVGSWLAGILAIVCVLMVGPR
jgi:hypothetical protein